MTWHAEIEVKCIYCKNKRWIGPGPEIPMCEKDGGVMIATGKARAENK